MLVSPAGRGITLFDRTGSSADDLSLDVLLRDYESTPAIGTWKLTVSDHASRDVGSLRSWSLRFVD